MDDWSYHKNKAPYASDDGPKVIPSWVAYLDILGYSDFIIRAMEHEDSSLSLKQLRSALDDAYYQIRSYSQMEGIPFYSIKIFTDNIVLGFPVQSFESFGGYVIFPRNTGHRVKNYTMIHNEVFYEKQSKKEILRGV